jgi:hypothetical protein
MNALYRLSRTFLMIALPMLGAVLIGIGLVGEYRLALIPWVALAILWVALVRSGR